jgi:signal transduction histidine kinase
LTFSDEIGNSAAMGETPESLVPGRSGSRRHESHRASYRRRAAEDALLDAILLPGETGAGSVGAAGQTLLMKALGRIERQAGIGGCVAWALDAKGLPRVVAAKPARYANELLANAESFAALAGIPDVMRLTDGNLPVDLRPLAARGVTAVAPVGGLGPIPAAILLVFSEHPGRPLRPRTIATLREVALGLARSMSTQLAVERLGQLDSAVQRLDRLASLGGLVSEIVHEVRNPLVSVKTFLQLLPDRLDDPEFHGEFRSLVLNEVGRLERMLDDLLRHARPRATAVIGEETRIEQTVAATLQLLTYRCRERGVELESRISTNLPAIALSEDALRQLLLNLLLNATEVTEAGSRVRLSIDWSPTEMNHLELRVEDEGPGIDPAAATKLFEPFWTTRGDESVGGLGLAICKQIVEEADGSIEVHNTRRGGACFRVMLKIAS